MPDRGNSSTMYLSALGNRSLINIKEAVSYYESKRQMIELLTDQNVNVRYEFLKANNSEVEASTKG